MIQKLCMTGVAMVIPISVISASGGFAGASTGGVSASRCLPLHRFVYRIFGGQADVQASDPQRRRRHHRKGGWNALGLHG